MNWHDDDDSPQLSHTANLLLWIVIVAILVLAGSHIGTDVLGWWP